MTLTMTRGAAAITINSSIHSKSSPSPSTIDPIPAIISAPSLWLLGGSLLGTTSFSPTTLLSTSRASRFRMVGYIVAASASAMGVHVLSIAFGVPAVLALSLSRDRPTLGFTTDRSNRKQLFHRLYPPLRATTEHNQALFWPASSLIAESIHSDAFNDDTLDDDEKLLTSTLDSVVKVYATHSEPDFLIPWQKKHQTTSTSSGFVLDVPGVGYRVMTNAHSVEYGSVVQVQRRGDDEKHAAVVEAVGNECDLALLRVDSLFASSDGSSRGNGKTYALPLGPLPPLQDEVEVLGYPAGGDSLCVTKGVVSRIEMQEYAQAGARLLSMQIDAAINPGTINNCPN